VELFAASLAALTTGIPGYLVLLAGIVFAAVRWKAHPRASALAMAGLGSMLLLGLAGTMLFTIMPMRLAEAGATMEETARTMATIGIARGLLYAGATVLVVIAIFIDRNPTTRT
jgi:hypothetical protein